MKKNFNFFLVVFSVAILVLLSKINYLLFHTIVELIAVSLGFSLLFMLLSRTKFNEISKFDFLLILYFFVSLIDLLHALSYKGISIFPSITANESTQLWISARLLESLAIFFYTISFKNKFIKNYIKLVFNIVLVFLILYFLFTVFSIFIWKNFPDCFKEGSGLTGFKKITEYIIILILLISLILGKDSDDPFFYYYRVAIIITIFSEFSFTLYKDVYGLFNLIGHILKYISFIFIYRYLMINIIEQPYSKIKILANELENEKQQLILAKDEAEKANIAKSTFLANINHEINTPLNVISGYTFVLYNEEIESDKKDILQKIIDAAQILYKIFDNLLTISKIELGEFKIGWDKKNLKDTIRFFCDLYKPKAVDKELYFKVELDNSLDKNIFIPENVIEKIILNLFDNAVKFTDKGYIYFSANFENNLLYMNFKYSGNGIDILSYTDLVNPFNIGEYYLNKTHDGVGLGLSIVNRLLKLVNGKIDFKSKIGEGTEFSVVLDLDISKYNLPRDLKDHDLKKNTIGEINER